VRTDVLRRCREGNIAGIELLNDLVRIARVVELEEIVELEHAVRAPVGADLELISDRAIDRDVDLLLEVKPRLGAIEVRAGRCVGLLIAIREVNGDVTIHTKIDRGLSKNRWDDI